MPQIIPSFFVVGAQKAGTTALHHYLARHPDIFLPKIKETHFFNDGHGEWRQGFNYYLQKYFSSRNEKKLAGEIDPEYLFFPETAGRIAAHIPNAKLIFIFREPVSRAYSHYWMTVYRGLEKLDFATAIEKEQERMRLGPEAICHYSYVGRGYYFTQLQNYLKHFPRENMLFLLSDDLKHQPMQTLLKIYRFLGVEPIPYKPLPRELTHETGMPISMSLQDFLATPSLTKSVAKLLLPDSVRHYMRNLIMKKNKRPAHFPPIPAVIQIHLKKLYREEIINLSRIVQLDLDCWISLNSHDLKQSNNVYTI